MSSATPRPVTDDTAAQRSRLRELGVPWVQLGDDLVLLAGDEEPERVAKAARGTGVTPTTAIAAAPGSALYVVTQIGRLFQHDHPNARVLVDRGRYLIVELDPARAGALASGPEHGYEVRPLQEESVIFDVQRRPEARLERSNAVQALVSALERDALEARLNHLVSFPTRFSTSSHFAEAAEWARGEMAALGYDTLLTPFPIPGGMTSNVIAARQGSGPAPRGLILVTAHLDSVNHDDGPAGPAPGADDNGSGSAGVLEMARVLAACSAAHDLQMILFGGEEQGLFGSLHYVANLSPEDRARLRAVVNMDMIGTLNTPAPAVLLEGAAVSQRLIDGLTAAAATYANLTVQVSLNPFGSDHMPFINEGLPAVLTIEGTDSANPHEHTANDTLAHINYDLMLEILRMNTAFVATELAGTG